MSLKELKRVKVLERVFGGCMSNLEAAEYLGVSIRQLGRLKAKYAVEGEAGLIHGNRNRKPKHALPENLKHEVLRLFEEKYFDANFCHCADLLSEHEEITISPSSVERILKTWGKQSKRPHKRRAKKHQPRERRRQAGMLWQIDATPHRWLGSDTEPFSLHAIIDDATGTVVGAFFMRNECMEGHSEAMRRGIFRYGIPLALYSDKHTIFRSPKEKLTQDEELSGQAIPLSNFAKALADLGIQHIKACTPQAKGRIERLWETLQDRLPVEMRLLGITNIEEANIALPFLIDKHNKRFTVPPAESETAYRPLCESIDLKYVFAWRTTRKIGSGGEISYKNKILVPNAAGLHLAARTTIEVRETFDGDVVILHKGNVVELSEVIRFGAKHNIPGNVEIRRLIA